MARAGAGVNGLRLATPADNAALLAHLGRHPMAGDVVLSARRDPDFFALHAMQRGITECWLYEAHGRIAAFGTLHVRDGWLGGRPIRVGYLGDLRVDFAGARARVVERAYGDILEHARTTHGVAAFHTAVLASNVAAERALVRRRPERGAQPRYVLLRRFDMASIQFTGRRRPHRGTATVRTATPADLGAIADLLDRDHRARPLGYRFDAGELQHRLAHWPGLSLEDTYLALDRTGGLAGVTGVWNAVDVRRYHVLAYRGGMRWVRALYAPAARMLRWTPLPRPGEAFRYGALVHTSIVGDDPEVFRALLERIYDDRRARGEHFLSLCVYEGDPLAPALRGFLTRRLAFTLYQVAPAEGPVADIPAGRPGFEMALA